MQVTSLASKFFLLCPLFLYSFDNLYSLSNKDFEISIIEEGYKLTLNNQKYLDYKETKGFKFFIPYFTKEFALKVLRYNSTGYINGILSMDRTFSKVLKITPVDYKYYLTDYKSDGRELDYLLKGYSIPYYKVTSISIEAYNIPYKISSKLNKYIYFNKIPLQNNKLSNILYSFYMILDKQKIDNYVKSHYPNSKNYIATFLSHINEINLTPKPKRKKIKIIKKNPPKVIKKPVKKSKPKVNYRLHLNRFLYMKDYGYIIKNYNLNLSKLNEKTYKIVDEIDSNVSELKSKFKDSFVLKPAEKFISFDKNIEEINDQILKLDTTINKPKCVFNPEEIDERCFKQRGYFHNYVYTKLKKNEIVDDDKLLSYGDYKTFNDIGKYYFEIGEFTKSELYLQRAYVLAKDKSIVSHNLGVLYANPHTSMYDIKKAIQYLEESNMDIDNYNIGVFYYMGKGVKESDKIAREYFQRATTIPFAIENLKIMQKYKIGIK